MLRLAIARSPLLAWLLAVLHGIALALVLALPLPIWGSAALGASIVGSAVHAILLHALHGLRSSLVGLEISDDCRVSVIDRAGATHGAELLPSSVVTAWLTLLNLRRAGRRRARTLILVPDRVDPDLYRRLRVLLRWRCRGAGVEETPLL
jgi:toxin CptA